MRFVDSEAAELRLGVVSGRRRQGKTYLLQSLSEAVGGFYFVAVESTSADALRQLGAAVAAYLDYPTPLSFQSWDEAIAFMLDQCAGRVAILDEFPYLLKSEPSIASIIQREIDARGERHGGPSARLLLAGSAMSVMGKLLAGQAPLRGRASLDLVVQPFDYRAAAQFWGISEVQLAARVHAVVGGTPAYRTLFVDREVPSCLDDFDDWIVRRVLSVDAPLFREARYLLSNEPEVRDEGLYHAVLGAIAAGNNTRGGIANYMGRKSTDLAHPLSVLEDCQLIRKESDPVRRGASAYRVAEPLVTFYESVMRNAWSQLELGHGERVWQASKHRFSTQVLGPHFEQLCRRWALGADWSGSFAAEVAAGVAQGGRAGSNIEVDVMVLGPQDGSSKRRLLSAGEAKWAQRMDLGHLARLRQARDQLHVKGLDTRDTVLALYSGAGFDDRLRAEADGDSRILLADLETLYRSEL